MPSPRACDDGLDSLPGRPALKPTHLLARASAYPVLPLQTPTNATEAPSHNGDSGTATPSTNGPAQHDEVENKQIADILEGSAISAEVSVSGGSDTEASTGRISKPTDDKGNGRASSAAKKPTSFKSVSVNKTFLGQKAAAANAASRPESAASSATVTPTGTPGLQASKLKLVAKNSSNLGGSTKTLTANGKSGAAPDASTVWNRNRRRLHTSRVAVSSGR